MKIDVIIPTNNIKEINGFINSFNTMINFKKYCTLVIIGNGKVIKKSIKNTSNVKFIRDDNNYSNQLVPFAKLRGIGMKNSIANWFLFLDDDNRFPKECDSFYMKIVNFIYNSKDCCTIQLDRKRIGKRRTKIQESGFFWCGYGLLIKNVFKIADELINFKGCCEETLFSYEALDKFGLPYICYGNPTYRDKSKSDKWNEENNESYSEKVIQDNIQGYIQNKYKDKNWRYYNDIPNGNFPKKLKEKIEKRFYNEKY